jgi:hypothetical protein
MKEISMFAVSSEELQQMITKAVEKGIEAQQLRTSSDEGLKEEVFLTRQQVCEKMHVTLPHLYTLKRRGILSPHKLGGKVLYKLSDVMEAPQKIRPIIQL